jgi:hypothetical protein
MADDIERVPFTEALWPTVQGFECGDLPYQKEVANWLKRPSGEDGALTSIGHKKKPGKVWLYRLKGGSGGFTSEDMMIYREENEEYQRMYVILDDEAHARLLEAAFEKRKK